MTFAVALAMLEREGRWLLQLRDDIEAVAALGLGWGTGGPVGLGLSLRE